MIFKYLPVALLFGAMLHPAMAFFSPHQLGIAFRTTIPFGFHPHLFGAELLNDDHQDPAPQHHTSLRHNNAIVAPARAHRVGEKSSHFDITLRAAHPADAAHFGAELAHDDKSLTVLDCNDRRMDDDMMERRVAEMRF